MKKILTMVLLMAVVITACSTEGKKAEEAVATAKPLNSKAEAAKSEGTVESADKAKKKELASIRLVLKGGEMAGTYEAVCLDAGCSYELAGDDVFGLQYSETGKGEKELSSVQMIVPEVTGNKKTNEFTVTISFGDFLEGKSYTISTTANSARPKGKGTLELTYDNDKEATVKISGLTEEGVEVDLTVVCKRVLTQDNMMEELGL